MSDHGRRELLGSGAAIVTSLGFAGIASAAGSDREPSQSKFDGLAEQDRQGVPGYADWIPDPAAGTAASQLRGAWHYEMEALLAVEDQGEGPSDPMLANPFAAGATSVFLWMELQGAGIAQPIVGPALSGEEVDPATVPADRGLIIGSAQVYLGSFDGAALQNAVDAGNFSETGTTGVYAHGAQDTVVTWDDGYVVIGPTEAQVDTLVGTNAGDVDRRHEVDSDFERLIGTAGHGDFSVLQLSEGETLQLNDQGDLSDYSMFDGCKGFAQSASSNDDGALAGATTAVVYAGEDRVDLARLESNLGTEAADRTVEQDGRNVTIDASYDGAGDGTDGEDGRDGTDGEDGTGQDGSDGDTDGQDGDGGDTDGQDGGDGDTDDQDGDGGDDGQETDDDQETDDADETDGSEDDGDSLPGPGVLGAIASIGAGGYLLSRRSDEAE